MYFNYDLKTIKSIQQERYKPNQSTSLYNEQDTLRQGDIPLKK